ncbi:MAG: N-acetyl-alpha-D-glucosaminyl L-malate synthase [Candidatus Ordinivivax streblomastigis]|uniref:N-acetyl-alpha-D-glucosaminyl L-malate synthase n=1 Tax=Candidatus Ordinivivax streblomastigis TaxID=2540710 RepID=A0A5M8P1V3_9BACT|nr:MAG: N-acetyl-alpha-D-glucosaminyl L-malate synthase [Candidatus Ordinivivax streblomastigis]
MKILLANKFYYPRGGDCIYTLNVESLLKNKGHEVAIFAMQHPENLPSTYQHYFPSETTFSLFTSLLESFQRPLGSKEVIQKFNYLVDDFQPDIVHLNNIHSQLSPVIAKIAYQRGIKVVWTLHDYKLLCPRYDCLRNGYTPCEQCFSDKIKVIKNRCMKNSLPASFLSYLEAIKWTKEKLEKYTTTFIAPSRFISAKMIQGGFDAGKIVILNNFIDIKKTEYEPFQKEDYYAYVGRLSIEKGINTLVKTAQQLPYKLKIAGTGPLWTDLKKNVSPENIEWLGHQSWPEIKELVGKARFTIIPSEWYENNPLSALESLCLGTPVLGANIGGIPELIEEEKNGMLFDSKNENDLKDKIEIMFSKEFDYQSIAKESCKRYAAEHYYTEIMKIYQQ